MLNTTLKNVHILIEVRKLSVIVCLMVGCVRCTSNTGSDSDQTFASQSSHNDSAKTQTSELAIDSVPDSKKNFKKFKIPQGIDQNRLVVAFYDELCKCPIVTVYDNRNETKATRSTFYPDGKTDQKKLIPLSPSSFGERFEDWPDDKPHYEVYPAIVQYVHTNGSIGATYKVIEIE